MYPLLIFQLVATTPEPIGNWSNIGYFQDEGSCNTVLARIRQLRQDSLIDIACVPVTTPLEKKV